MDDEVRTQLVSAVANSIDDHLEAPVEREDGEAVAVCSCGWRRVSGTFTVATLDYARHRAAAVIDALGIERLGHCYCEDCAAHFNAPVFSIGRSEPSPPRSPQGTNR